MALGLSATAAYAIWRATEAKRQQVERATGRPAEFIAYSGAGARGGKATQPQPQPQAQPQPQEPASQPISSRHLVDTGVFVRGIVMSSPTRRNPHWGIDIGAPEGTPVRAAKSGTIVLSRPVAGYGNCIYLSHAGLNESTLYGHLRASHVREGQQVQAGEQIGEVGTTTRGRNVRIEGSTVTSVGNESTGGVTRPIGPHLHMEVHPRQVPAIGPTPQRLDPVRWLSSNGIAQFAVRWNPRERVDMGVA